jgi:hypothetical protein
MCSSLQLSVDHSGPKSSCLSPPPPPMTSECDDKPLLLSSYHVTSLSSFGKKGPPCLTTFWVAEYVAYCQLVNRDKKFYLVASSKFGFSESPADEGQGAPCCNNSYKFCCVFSELQQGFSCSIILSCFIYKLFVI